MRVIASDRWRSAWRWNNASRNGIENSWKTLDLVLSLIKHAETKAIATLAASGVVGQILFALVQPGSKKAPIAVLVSAGVCALFVTGSGLCAMCVLWPRLKSGDSASNLLYFGDFMGDRSLTRQRYVQAMVELSRRPDDIAEQLAAQVWANADVARRKFRFADSAVSCLLVAMVVLAVTAFVSAALARP